MKFDLIKLNVQISMFKNRMEKFSLTGDDRVLSRIEREFHPLAIEIEQSPPAPLPRVLLWLLAGITVSFLAWSYFSKIDVISTAEGRVIPDGRLKVLQSTDSATVKAIFVREGSHVSEGQVLIELDPTISNADITSSSERATLMRLELIRLNSELSGTKADYKSADGKAEYITLQETLKAARAEQYKAKISEAKTILDLKRWRKQPPKKHYIKLSTILNRPKKKRSECVHTSAQ